MFCVVCVIYVCFFTFHLEDNGSTPSTTYIFDRPRLKILYYTMLGFTPLGEMKYGLNVAVKNIRTGYNPGRKSS